MSHVRTMSVTAVVSAGEIAPPPPAKSLNRLRDLKIRSFSASDFEKPPVVAVHAHRESGLSTLLASLLVETQQAIGLDGAVVLTDRPTDWYMGGCIPPQIILDKSFPSVLKALIELQRHRKSSGRPLLRLALAVDDVFYTPKILKSEFTQRDIKAAKDYNIMIIIATSDVTVLPTNVHTFATHVMTTKCLSTEEPKLLQKRMFVMFDNAVALADTIALCQKHEFLVGLLRPQSFATLLDFSCSYQPTYYAKSAAYVHADRWEGQDETDVTVSTRAEIVEAEFVMDPELIVHITHALRTA